MRVQVLLVVAIAILASVQAASPRPKPPAPTSFTCSPTTAATLGDTLTNSINEALLPNATKTITNSKSQPYWQFSVPTYCWDNVFGFGQKVHAVALPYLCCLLGLFIFSPIFRTHLPYNFSLLSLIYSAPLPLPYRRFALPEATIKLALAQPPPSLALST